MLVLIGGLVLSLPATVMVDHRRSRANQSHLAILPFRPLNADEDTAFLTTGLADAITTRLANVHQIRVRPTNTILNYEGQTVSAKTVGQELSCNYVVLGTLQKLGERLQVNVQLVRTSDEALIWGEQFDKVRTDILSLQDAVATQIADALRIKMTAAEQSRVYRRYTENVAAYELYLLGRSKLVRYTREDTLAAIKAFEDALAARRELCACARRARRS